MSVIINCVLDLKKKTVQDKLDRCNNNKHLKKICLNRKS